MDSLRGRLTKARADILFPSFNPRTGVVTTGAASSAFTAGGGEAVRVTGMQSLRVMGFDVMVPLTEGDPDLGKEAEGGSEVDVGASWLLGFGEATTEGGLLGALGAPEEEGCRKGATSISAPCGGSILVVIVWRGT